MKIKKGDMVQIIAGKGAAGGKTVTGKVLKVLIKKDRVLIEGYNLVKRHTKPRGRGQQGGIIEKEAPIHVSNVMVLSPKSGRPTRVGVKILENKSKVRFSRKLQEEIE
ncbi:MAG: 50S ribosomal protein L24 [Fibrobacterota bacterium]